MAVFHCGTNIGWIYILAQIAAALSACCVFAFVSGAGPLAPWVSMRTLGLTSHEAVVLWLFGSPPARLETNGHENITEVLKNVKLEREATLAKHIDVDPARDHKYAV